MTSLQVLKNRDVVAIAYDGLCAFEFGVAAELFGLDRPEMGDDWYRFSVASIDASPLRTLGGVTMTAPWGLEAVERAGTIVLPGWRDVDEAPPDELLETLRRAHRSGARLMSICSGVFILAATGLLDGQPATTHWRYTDKLSAAFPAIDVRPDVLYVDNGSILTSAGSAAGLDLGLHLIRRDFGPEAANLVARRLVIPPQRDGGQAQFIQTPVPAWSDSSLSATMDWAIERLDQKLDIASLAGHAVMTERTFARRFRAEVGMTPHRWVIAQRVLRAQHLLEVSDASIESVAHSCGFASAAGLRHHFERAVQTTPTRFRARFAS